MNSSLFVYGTLMRGFNRPVRRRVDRFLSYSGRGRLAAALFDLGTYPVAIPASDSWVWGEVYAVYSASEVLGVLDAFEGCGPGEPPGLFARREVDIVRETGEWLRAWAYVGDAAPAGAIQIASGDYTEYLTSLTRPVALTSAPRESRR